MQVTLTKRSHRVTTHKGDSQGPAADSFMCFHLLRLRLLRHVAGEVCLPGGKREPGDRDNVATALREAHEEIGLDSRNVHVIGCLQPFLSKHMLSVGAVLFCAILRIHNRNTPLRDRPFLQVTPVVAVLEHPQQFYPRELEVDCIFKIPLALVLDDHSRHTWKDLSWELPGTRSLAWHRIHFFNIHEHNIWGLTAGILIEVAEQGYGRPAGFQVHMIHCQPFHNLTYENGQLQWRQDQPDPRLRISPV